ncbi:hypothetical protein BS78_01G241200 [Paspalum vaginatum]|nr:hypothetical protein BS78_01G241200 [Paspalum vaginatum]
MTMKRRYLTMEKKVLLCLRNRETKTDSRSSPALGVDASTKQYKQVEDTFVFCRSNQLSLTFIKEKVAPGSTLLLMYIDYRPDLPNIASGLPFVISYVDAHSTFM